MLKSFWPRLATESLLQNINPWRWSFINIELGQTPHPEIEQMILDEVGSYGRQLGRIGDALQVLLDHLQLKGLTAAEQDALDVLRGQLAQIRMVKRAALRRVTPARSE
jgi:hypothetical protein